MKELLKSIERLLKASEEALLCERGKARRGVMIALIVSLATQRGRLIEALARSRSRRGKSSSSQGVEG